MRFSTFKNRKDSQMAGPEDFDRERGRGHSLTSFQSGIHVGFEQNGNYV